MPDFRGLVSSSAWDRVLRAIWLDLPEKLSRCALWIFAAARMLILLLSVYPGRLFRQDTLDECPSSF